MAQDLLGDSFDIHGGGNDLMFPHHENEIAQSKCAGHDFANIWMHNEMLQVEGKKMSKSLGNFFTVRDLLDQGVPGEVIRFVMLSTHYGNPMDWTEEKSKSAEDEIWLWALETTNVKADEKPPIGVVVALSEDLNTHAAITELRRLFKEGEFSSLKAGLEILGFDLEAEQSSISVLNFMKKTQPFSELVRNALESRKEAKRCKDFALADQIRDTLSDAGVSVKDDKDGGMTFKFERTFDPSKLEALK
jgi:cysteinyl-tRNA synthetase